MTHEQTKVDQLAPAADSADAELLDQYMDLLDRFGPDSQQAKDFEARHPTARLKEFSTSVHELESSARKGRLARLLVPVAWLTCFLVVGLIGGVAVFHGLEASSAQQQAQKKQETLDVAEAGWGWTKPGALPDDLAPGSYFIRLADEAHEYFDKRPETPVDLAKRLCELRKGCAVLILSNHQPLSKQDRDWLVEKCRLWAEHLDNEVTNLENGKDFATIQSRADGEVTSLEKALREHAQSL